MRLEGGSSKLYLVVGTLLIVIYVVTELRGTVFGGTDSRGSPVYASSSSGGGRPTGGAGWFVGYSGGK